MTLHSNYTLPSHGYHHGRGAQRANRPAEQLKRKQGQRLAKQIEGPLKFKK
jgi:hypothetical protein